MYFFVVDASRTDSVDGAASIWLMYRSRSSVLDLNMVVVPNDDVIEAVTATDDDDAVTIVVVVLVSVDAGETSNDGGDSVEDADDNLSVAGAAVAPSVFDSSSLRV